MDLRRLRHAVLLADEGSFSRAGHVAHLTQPALSRSIQALERQLGLILFERSSSGVTPTTAGAHVIALARGLLRDAAGLSREAELLRTGDAGTVRFGIGPMLAPVLTPLIPDMVCAHPALQIEVELDAVHRLLEPLRADRIDFCVAAVDAVAHEADLEITSGARWPFGYYVRAGHPLADGDVSATDLEAYPLASSRVPSGPGLPRAVSMHPVAWRGHVLCADSQTLKRVVLESDAVLLAMAPSVAMEHAGRRLKRLDYAPGREWRTTIGIARRKGRPMTPAAEKIMAGLEAAIRRCASELPSG
jgi:DNA-binding transcriptional LysR family regulator